MDPLEPELQAIVNHLEWVHGPNSGALQEQNVPNHLGISLAHNTHSLKHTRMECSISVGFKELKLYKVFLSDHNEI